MANCSGVDRAASAAEPDWLAQADTQMSDLYSTIEQINDPSLFEAWTGMEDRLNQLNINRMMDREYL